MKIIIMLIWAGMANGGPTTIQGFHSLAACERAATQIMKENDIANDVWFHFHAKCREFDAE